MRAKYLQPEPKREPTEISDLLGVVIEKASVGIDVRHGELVSRWEEVAPPDWVRFGRPAGVRRHTLLVEVPDGTAASLLRYQVNDLQRCVAEHFGADLITSVRIRVGGTPRPERSRESRD
ncbi:MAG: DUF721 domain-containing protein [Acidimicrobiia bacterium]|nr:DUF721 domain-containing protein [Acidimicrobiia bacterium]